AAGGDGDVRRGQASAVDLDGVRIDEAPEAAQQGYAGLLQQAVVDAVETLDVSVSPGLEGTPVEGRRYEFEAVAGGVMELAGHVGGVPHHLLRYAADVHAG